MSESLSFLSILSLYFLHVYSQAYTLPATISASAQATSLKIQSGSDITLLSSGDAIVFKDPGVNKQVTITMSYNWDGGDVHCPGCWQQLLFTVDRVQHDCHLYYSGNHIRSIGAELSVTYISDGTFRNILIQEIDHYFFSCEDAAAVIPQTIIGYIYPATSSPTHKPTTNPSVSPTNDPTHDPTAAPSLSPSKYPTISPTYARSPTIQVSNWTQSLITSPRSLVFSQSAVDERTRTFYMFGDDSDGTQMIRYNLADDGSISSFTDFGANYLNISMYKDQFYCMHSSVVYYTDSYKLYEIDFSNNLPQPSYYDDVPLQAKDPCITYHTSHHDYLFIVGGSQSSTKIGATQILDITIASWLINTPNALNIARDKHVCVTLNQQIFVIGGSNTAGTSIEILDVSQMDDIQSYSWRIMSDILTRRRDSGHTADVYATNIFIIGGWNATEIEVIDTVTETVSIMAYMDPWREYHSTVYYYPYLRILGGIIEDSHMSYDIRELFISSTEVNIGDYPVNIFPTTTTSVAKTISFRSAKKSAVTRTYHAKFNIIGAFCYNPHITLYYYHQSASYLNVYHNDTRIQQCFGSVCDDPVYCFQNRTLTNIVSPESQVHIYVEIGDTTGALALCAYTLWADITLECDIIPTQNPTTDPTQIPTVIPSKHPTLNPTISPTFQPTSTPIFNPTAIPTISPTFKPTSIPTISKTLKPTLIPTISPTFTPTLNPTYAPSNEPTNKPTIAPTAEPTINPTVNPTTAKPTLNPVNSVKRHTPSPTQAPLFCDEGKYKHRMSNKDHLWTNDVFVSNNCLCKLAIDKSGNLILFGKISVSDTELINGWMTDTKVSRRSGQSVAKLEITENGLMLNEYLYKNVPSFAPIVLWSKEAHSEHLILDLSDACCLKLVEKQTGLEHLIWSVCAKGIFATSSHTEIFWNVTSDSYHDRTKIMRGKKKGNAWIVLLIVLFGFIFIVILIICKRVHAFEKEKWVQAPKRRRMKMKKEEIEIDLQMEQQITTWVNQDNTDDDNFGDEDDVDDDDDDTVENGENVDNSIGNALKDDGSEEIELQPVTSVAYYNTHDYLR